MKMSKANRSASAESGILIVLLIAAVVFSVQWWIKKNTKDPNIFDLPPWKEWKIRQKNQKPPQQLNEQQPQIKEAISFEGSVKLPNNNSPRGKIKLKINTDGSVSGDWYGEYYNEKKLHCDILLGGDFSGNVYPSKVYKNEEGTEDRSKLYFIAKGDFTLQVTHKSKVGHESGDLYIKGWLTTDNKASGEMIITSNEKYFETFTWRAIQTKSKY